MAGEAAVKGGGVRALGMPPGELLQPIAGGAGWSGSATRMVAGRSGNGWYRLPRSRQLGGRQVRPQRRVLDGVAVSPLKTCLRFRWLRGVPRTRHSGSDRCPLDCRKGRSGSSVAGCVLVREGDRRCAAGGPMGVRRFGGLCLWRNPSGASRAPVAGAPYIARQSAGLPSAASERSRPSTR